MRSETCITVRCLPHPTAYPQRRDDDKRVGRALHHRHWPLRDLVGDGAKLLFCRHKLLRGSIVGLQSQACSGAPPCSARSQVASCCTHLLHSCSLVPSLLRPPPAPSCPCPALAAQWPRTQRLRTTATAMQRSGGRAGAPPALPPAGRRLPLAAQVGGSGTPPRCLHTWWAPQCKTHGQGLGSPARTASRPQKRITDADWHGYKGYSARTRGPGVQGRAHGPHSYRHLPVQTATPAHTILLSSGTAARARDMAAWLRGECRGGSGGAVTGLWCLWKSAGGQLDCCGNAAGCGSGEEGHLCRAYRPSSCLSPWSSSLQHLASVCFY